MGRKAGGHVKCLVGGDGCLLAVHWLGVLGLLLGTRVRAWGVRSGNTAPQTGRRGWRTRWGMLVIRIAIGHGSGNRRGRKAEATGREGVLARDHPPDVRVHALARPRVLPTKGAHPRKRELAQTRYMRVHVCRPRHADAISLACWLQTARPNAYSQRSCANAHDGPARRLLAFKAASPDRHTLQGLTRPFGNQPRNQKRLETDSA